MLRVASFRRSVTLGLSAVALTVATGCLSIDQVEDGVAILTIISGNGQTLTAGSQTSSAPLVVRTIDNSALPVEGVTVNWSITQGGGTISAGSSTTDDSGNASVTYKPGATAGTALIKATAEGLSVSFTQTITAAGT
jgi:hypothetical protein